MSEVFIAKEKIYVDGVLAHDVGHEVPAENVKLHGWQDLVARPETKAAEKAQQSTT